MRTTVCLAIFSLAIAFGQSAEESNLKFEVASVKPAADPASRGAFDETPNQVRIENFTLSTLIRIAYGLRVGERVEGPGWLDSARFDILAKPPDGYQPRTQTPILLRNLLTERFKLRVHTEATTISATTLGVAKGGFKLRESTSERTTLTYNSGQIRGKQRSISELAILLSNALPGRQILNETGLSGLYDIDLSWSPSRFGDLESESALMTALREQLGLQLESRKVAGNNIVVDRIEREPTEN